MYNPRLKDKHALVDLARYGTEARKSIHPDVLIGEHCVKCPPFREGDILDANATVNLIGDTLNCCEVFQTFDEEGQRIAERLDNLEQTQSENYTELSDKVDSLTETHEQDIARLDDKTDNLALNIINQERVVDISKQSEVGGKTSYLVTKLDGSHDTIIVAKGDKGDQGESFSYEDFTPEQLEALKVKGDKGDKGTSITRVQQTTVAYNDRGVNVITIDLDDGSSSLIQIRNGASGEDPQVRQDLQTEIARATSAENALQNNINSVNSRVDHIVEDAPEALDTLLEIAEKLHDEEDAVAALTLEISLKYTKPATGIPSSDMSESVRASLSKADTALQEHLDISGKADLADLATVATSGSYDDLADKPTIPSLTGYATEQWVLNQNYLTEHQDISGKADIVDLSNVAFSGDYEDLSNTPTIPTVPTNVSAFTNDAGYLTQHQDISGKQDVISDLDTIRSWAQAGSTALQPNALNDYYNKTQVDNKLSEKQDTISDLATIRTGAGMGATALQPSALNNYYNKDQVDIKLSSKQDTISNLATIEAGAAKGATSLQPSDKGVANGVATLNENGVIPSSQLPSYVDDVLEYESSAEFPVTGESGKIYVDLLTNKTYRWGSSDYVEISESLALGETSSTAYAGNKGKATTDAFNAHAANTDIHVTAAKQAAWDAKSDFSGSYNDLTDKPTTLNGYGITDAYTKTEVNGLVDTPHQEYVTVDAYVGLPETGSKDTIYRVSNYNGSTSQVDPSVYSEYAWDGSQYIFLCVKSQIDEVFDISVYNNNAKYADLAAALNGGANIPQSLQKGGISVKFVDSTSNQYLQCRLLSTTWSADPNNWVVWDECFYDDNPEFMTAHVDRDGRLLTARRNDGTKEEYKKVTFLNEIQAKEDVKVHGSLYVDDKLITNKLDIKDDEDTLSEIYVLEDPEGRMRVELDEGNKIISYRDKRGILHENVGLEVPSISFIEGNTSFVEKIEYDGKECVVRDMALLYPVETYKSVFENYKIGGFQGNTGSQVHNNLSLLWFTDVHESTENLTRIKAFYDVYKGYFDDAIVTGDIMNNFDNDFNFWTNIDLKNVLMVMGNHDPETVYSGNPNVRETVTEQVAYERFFEPFLNDTDIVCEENKAYWYKDYPTIVSAECEGGVRLIGLHQEPSWSGDGQMEWLQERLSECLAEGNRKAVIIAVHGPFKYDWSHGLYPHIIDVDCSFNSFYKVPAGTTYINNDMLSAVQSFIDNGGEFICWMGGHTHQDWFVRHSEYPDQILIILGTASYKTTFRQEHMLANTKSMDRFNIFSVDPVNKHIRLFRIGIDQDIYGRHVGNLVYDYANKELISNY